MLKILNTDQIRAWDAFTIEREPIPSIELMERACSEFTIWFSEMFDPSKSVAVVCGTGNNGGDGLGVARLLVERGYRATVWIIKGGVTESVDFKTNFSRLPKEVDFYEIEKTPQDDLFSSFDILIDGIFGSGLSKPIEGLYAEVIDIMNKSKATRIAIDVPSGLYADKATDGNVLQADYTLTFQIPKLAFFIPESGQHVGSWHSADIKLNKEFLSQEKVSHFLITRESIIKRVKRRGKFSHKGNFGKALMVAGSYGKMGACVLAARAALRTGVGLLTLHVPTVGYSIVQTAVPEAMVAIDNNEQVCTHVEEVENYSSIGIGPGLGQHKKTIEALSQILEASERPLVIDADALNMLSSNRALLHLIPAGSILTPHPGELVRLVGPCKNGFERLEKAIALATELGVIVVLKGAYTAIVSTDGKVHFNSTGNSGMATGGSGDVLTGVITSFLAQGYQPFDAALVGVYLHGLAGDLASYDLGQQALIASDLIAYLPHALKKCHFS